MNLQLFFQLESLLSSFSFCIFSCSLSLLFNFTVIAHYCFLFLSVFLHLSVSCLLLSSFLSFPVSFISFLTPPLFSTFLFYHIPNYSILSSLHPHSFSLCITCLLLLCSCVSALGWCWFGM